MTAATANQNAAPAPGVPVEAAELTDLCRGAILRHGGSPALASSLASAIVHAEFQGKRSVGVVHFLDYVDALDNGRINGTSMPTATWPTPALVLSDAHGSIPHLAFDGIFDELVQSTRTYGVCMLSIKDAYTCGETGYFVDRLARCGLVSIAGANTSALMSLGGSSQPVLGTNPLAFGAPRQGLPPLVVDQASSQTAFVNIREAARTKTPIPADWALDRSGEQTTIAESALAGTLLPFGGYKGGNIGLMIEMLATLSGANWSLDARPFDTGTQNPSVGMFVICLDPARFDPDYVRRLSGQLDRLATDYGVRLPGRSRAGRDAPSQTCELPVDLYKKLQELSG